MIMTTTQLHVREQAESSQSGRLFKKTDKTFLDMQWISNGLQADNKQITNGAFYSPKSRFITQRARVCIIKSLRWYGDGLVPTEQHREAFALRLTQSTLKS